MLTVQSQNCATSLYCRVVLLKKEKKEIPSISGVAGEEVLKTTLKVCRYLGSEDTEGKKWQRYLGLLITLFSCFSLIIRHPGSRVVRCERWPVLTFLQISIHTQFLILLRTCKRPQTLQTTQDFPFFHHQPNDPKPTTNQTIPPKMSTSSSINQIGPITFQIWHFTWPLFVAAILSVLIAVGVIIPLEVRSQRYLKSLGGRKS